MLKTSHLTATSYSLQPWKNGKGQSKEIAIDSQNPFLWRVTLSTLETENSFSNYPEYERLLLLLNEGPALLDHGENGKKELRALEPYRFSGLWNTTATLQKPAADLNVFTRVEKSKANLFPSYMSLEEEVQFPISAQEHFLYCSAGSLKIREPNNRVECQLKAGETFRISRKNKKEFLNLKAYGTSEWTACFWIVIHILKD